MDLRTRYRTKFGWIFWLDTTKGKWHILYLRARYRSKLGWFFWFCPIHMTIRCNLAIGLPRRLLKNPMISNTNSFKNCEYYLRSDWRRFPSSSSSCSLRRTESAKGGDCCGSTTSTNRRPQAGRGAPLRRRPTGGWPLKRYYSNQTKTDYDQS